jgi:hypothetical protein
VRRIAPAEARRLLRFLFLRQRALSADSAIPVVLYFASPGDRILGGAAAGTR